MNGEFTLRTDGADVTLSVVNGNVYLRMGTGVAEVDGQHFTEVMSLVNRAVWDGAS
jgi:hypothetical protein